MASYHKVLLHYGHFLPNSRSWTCLHFVCLGSLTLIVRMTQICTSLMQFFLLDLVMDTCYHLLTCLVISFLAITCLYFRVVNSLRMLPSTWVFIPPTRDVKVARNSDGWSCWCPKAGPLGITFHLEPHVNK